MKFFNYWINFKKIIIIFLSTIYVFIPKIELKSMNEKNLLHSFDFLNLIKNSTFTEKLSKYESRNYTDYSTFETIMLNLKLNRLQAKEIFHLIDRNNLGFITDLEWKAFFEVFVKPFIKFDKNKDNLLNFQEFKESINSDEKKRFKNMLEYNKKILIDEDLLINRILLSLDLDMKNQINFYEYIKFRNYNNAYDICLVKEKQITYKNFPAMVHFVFKNLRYYSIVDLKNMYNRTIEWSYLKSPKKNMDFPTFCTLMNLMKIYQNSDFNSQGILNFFDLRNSGSTVQTYILLQKFGKLFMKEQMVFNSLSYGIKINNIISHDLKKNLNLDLEFIKEYNKVSLENLFLLYRFFELAHLSNIRYPYSINLKNFTNILENAKKKPSKKEELASSILKNSSDLLDKSFKDFQAACQASGCSKSKREDFNGFIFNILDLNNNTSLEIYELINLDKATTLFNYISENMVLNKSKVGDEMKNKTILNKLKENNKRNIYQGNDFENNYINLMNFKFNTKKINFHQFLFLYLNRLKYTSNLVNNQRIEKYLNYYGFFISKDKQKEIFKKYDIRDSDFMSYILGIKEYLKFYSENF